MLQIPHELYAAELADDGSILPPPGDYAVANVLSSRAIRRAVVTSRRSSKGP